MQQQFFLSVMTEEHMPVLQRFLMILKRKSFKLEKIWVSETKTGGLFSISATVTGSTAKLENLCTLIEKQIDVLAVHGFAGYANSENIFISGKRDAQKVDPAAYAAALQGRVVCAELSGVLRLHQNEEVVR